MGEINSLILNVRHVSYSPVIEMTAGKYHVMGLHYSQTITTHKMWFSAYHVMSRNGKKRTYVSISASYLKFFATLRWGQDEGHSEWKNRDPLRPPTSRGKS